MTTPDEGETAATRVERAPDAGDVAVVVGDACEGPGELPVELREGVVGDVDPCDGVVHVAHASAP